MKYGVRITETLARTVIVEADSFEKAEDKVRDAYKEGRVILDADDFSDVEFGESPMFGKDPIGENDDRLAMVTELDEEQGIKVVLSDAIDLISEAGHSLSSMKQRYHDGMEAYREGWDESDDILCPMCRYPLACNDDDYDMRPKHCPNCGTKIKY